MCFNIQTWFLLCHTDLVNKEQKMTLGGDLLISIKVISVQFLEKKQSYC